MRAKKWLEQEYPAIYQMWNKENVSKRVKICLFMEQYAKIPKKKILAKIDKELEIHQIAIERAKIFEDKQTLYATVGGICALEYIRKYISKL